MPPYIRKDERPPLEAAIAALPQGGAGMRAGDIAYVVYKLMWKNVIGGSFLTHATVVGAVVLTVARFVQKETFKFEDEKERMNGGVEL
jgi:hypothetical protein